MRNAVLPLWHRLLEEMRTSRRLSWNSKILQKMENREGVIVIFQIDGLGFDMLPLLVISGGATRSLSRVPTYKT